MSERPKAPKPGFVHYLSIGGNVATIIGAIPVVGGFLGAWAYFGETWLPVALATFLSVAITALSAPEGMIRVRRLLKGSDALFEPLDAVAYNRLELIIRRQEELEKTRFEQLVNIVRGMDRSAEVIGERVAELEAILRPRGNPLLTFDQTTRFDAIERTIQNLAPHHAKIEALDERVSTLGWITYVSHLSSMGELAAPIKAYIFATDADEAGYTTIEPLLERWMSHFEFVARVVRAYDPEAASSLFEPSSSTDMEREKLAALGLRLPNVLDPETPNSLRSRIGFSPSFRLQLFWLREEAIQKRTRIFPEAFVPGCLPG